MAEADRTHVERFDETDGRLPEGWRAVEGDWRIADGRLCVDATGREARVAFGRPSWQNYEIEATVTFDRVDNDSRWVALVFRSGDAGEKPYSQCTLRFQCNRKDGAEFAVRLASGPWDVRKTAKLSENGQLGRPRKLRVVVHGANIESYVDGRMVMHNAYCLDRDAGMVGLAASGCAVRFDDVSVRLLPDSPKLGDKKPKPCLVVGHRGASAVAPENTLAAAAKAVELGAHGNECDVYASKDGVLVLMHDEKVDRTTDGSGKITEMTLAEIKKLDAGAWKDPQYAGQRVPTLAEFLALHQNTNCIPVIEIKMDGIARKVVDAIREAGMISRAAVIAFSADEVKEVRKQEPRLKCAWLCGKDLTGSAAERAKWIVDQARACDANTVDLHYNMLSDEVIAELHKQGIAVWTWTVDDPRISDALMRWGIDSITTNRPDMIVEQCKKAEK